MRGVAYPLASSAKVIERVELYLYITCLVIEGRMILTFRHRALSIYDRHFATLQRTLFIYLNNKYKDVSKSSRTVLVKRSLLIVHAKEQNFCLIICLLILPSFISLFFFYW